MHILKDDGQNPNYDELYRLRGDIADPDARDDGTDIMNCPIKSGVLRYLCNASEKGQAAFDAAKADVVTIMGGIMQRVQVGVVREGRGKKV